MTRLSIALCSTIMLIAGPAAADKAADDAVKHRKQVMAGIAASSVGIANTLKGEADHPIAALGAMLAASANVEITKAAFAMNTMGKSEAKTTSVAAIWDDPDDFQEGLQKLSDAAAAVAAKGADVTFDDLKPVFATCKSCHDDYRDK